VRIADLCAKIVSACSPSSKDQVPKTFSAHPPVLNRKALMTGCCAGHHHRLSAFAYAARATREACSAVAIKKLRLSVCHSDVLGTLLTPCGSLKNASFLSEFSRVILCTVQLEQINRVSNATSSVSVPGRLNDQ
jgi:hypothetical protein